MSKSVVTALAFPSCLATGCLGSKDCITAADCGTDTVCARWTCSPLGLCEGEFSPNATPLPLIGGGPDRCAERTCDGNGGIVSHNLPADATSLVQTTGDCQRALCDGNGGEVSASDPSDPPAGDGLCTEGLCQAGAAITRYRADWPGCGAIGNCPAPDATCSDSDDAGDDEASAMWLGNIDDPDGDGSARCGVLSSPTDVDWYAYHGHDTPMGYVDPTRNLTAPPRAKVRICAYFQCDQPPKTAECPDGTTPDRSPGGVDGCCGFQSFSVDLWCAPIGVDDDAKVLIRVDDPGHHACVGYDLAYHY